VAVGRKPNTQALQVNETGLLLDERGCVHVDELCRSNLPNVYAVGDLVRGPMLAHKAAEEAIMVVERIAGQPTRVNYDTIPWVIYTSPEIAWAGKSERQLRAAARDYKIGVFPLSASGRARAMGATKGMTKVLADRRTDRILGVHMVAAHAGEMLAEAVLALELEATLDEFTSVIRVSTSTVERRSRSMVRGLRCSVARRAISSNVARSGAVLCGSGEEVRSVALIARNVTDGAHAGKARGRSAGAQGGVASPAA